MLKNLELHPVNEKKKETRKNTMYEDFIYVLRTNQ